MFKFILISLLTITSLQALGADGASSCAEDSTTQERISDIHSSERVDVLNSNMKIVGAFVFNPEDGEMSALYLCGANSGYYYAEGNVYSGNLSAIYNDEYESVFEIENYDDEDVVNILLQAIYFSGDPESADYGPFSANLSFRKISKE